MYAMMEGPGDDALAATSFSGNSYCSSLSPAVVVQAWTAADHVILTMGVKPHAPLPRVTGKGRTHSSGENPRGGSTSVSTPVVGIDGGKIVRSSYCRT